MADVFVVVVLVVVAGVVVIVEGQQISLKSMQVNVLLPFFFL